MMNKERSSGQDNASREGVGVTLDDALAAARTRARHVIKYGRGASATGKVVGVVTRPALIVEDDRGLRRTIVLDRIDSMAEAFPLPSCHSSARTSAETPQADCPSHNSDQCDHDWKSEGLPMQSWHCTKCHSSASGC